MDTTSAIEFSIITPSSGKRPRALARAVSSVAEAVRRAAPRLGPGQVEMLVGFDGVKGKRPPHEPYVRFFDFRPDNDWGNGIRDLLLKIAKGRRILFLDDDNVLKPGALNVFLNHPDTEMVIGRIDTQLAHDKPYLPEDEPGRDLVRQCNIDPLCLCLSRELVSVRCGGWGFRGRYESDFLNIRQYHRRAASVEVIPDVVGVYDAGRGLDMGGFSPRQQRLLDLRIREKARGATAEALPDRAGAAQGPGAAPAFTPVALAAGAAEGGLGVFPA